MKLDNQAWLFAQKAHEGQIDDEGKDYFQAHLCHVANILKGAGCSVEVVAAGFLHDTVEDAGVDYPTLVMNFGQRVADLVMEVTHEGNKNKGYYFPRLKSRDAILIKLADQISNLMRMDGWNPSRQRHHLKKARFWKESANDKTR